MNTSTNHFFKLILSLIFGGFFLSACGQNDPEKPGNDEPDQNETKTCDPADYCKNGGKCTVNERGAKQCDCTGTSFTGDTCSEPKKAEETCEDSYCKNGGTCSFIDGKRSCDCTSTSFKGETCETPKTCEEDGPTCKNGGVCVVDQATNALTCDCSKTNFSGEICDEAKTCENANPCQNGGQCSVDGTTGALTCDCSKTGFAGEICNEPKTCENANPCQNGGECLVNSTTKALVCDCKRGWGGVFCEEEERAFRFKVKIDEAADYTIYTNPQYGSDYDYDLICDAGSKPEKVEMYQRGDAKCNYDQAGEYEVSIKGKFPQLVPQSDNYDIHIISLYITEIIDWGNGAWKSMEGIFGGAFGRKGRLIDLGESTPNFSQLTSMRRMFSNSSFNGTIPKTWDTSSVTNMSAMFSNAEEFNKDLSGLNTSNVINMSQMFFEASSFNENIDSWDTSSVTDMSDMFMNTTVFNRNLNHWDTSKVQDMSRMFNGTESFNGDISEWDTSNVTNMFVMFAYSRAFKRDISKWVVTSVQNCKSFSEGASADWTGEMKPKFSKCENPW